MGGGYNNDKLNISGSDGISGNKNGYIVFGTPYKNAIIQMGWINCTGASIERITFPISFNKNYLLSLLHSGTDPVSVCEIYTSHNLSSTGLKAASSLATNSKGWIIFYIAIGY